MNPSKGCGHGSLWSDVQIRGLREWYGKIHINHLCRKLQRSKKSIYMKAFELGLCRPKPETIRISPERYEEIMIEAARSAGLAPRQMFLDQRKNSLAAEIKHAAWAKLRSEGISLTSIASASGLNHTSILHGTRSHRKRVEQRMAAE